MSTFGKIVRYLFAIIFILILLPIFFLGIPLSATSQTFINRENVKEVLNNPAVYENLAQTFVESVSMMQESPSTEGASETLALLQQDPTFTHNLESIITSDETKAKVNTVIDAFYDWFEGKTASPEFEVYLIDDEETFRNIYVSIISAQLENLPTCSTSSYDSVPSNVLEMDCLPPYIDSTEIRTILEDSITSSDIDTQQLMDSFKFSSDQLNISEINSVMVQNIYKVVQLLPIILASVIVLLSLLVVLLIPGVKGGLITLSVIYILNGLLFLVGTVFGKSTQMINNAISLANVDIPYEGSTAFVTTLITPIFTKIISLMQIYSLVVIGVGVVLLIVGIVVKGKKKKIEAVIEEEKPKAEVKEEKKE